MACTKTELQSIKHQQGENPQLGNLKELRYLVHCKISAG